MFKSFVILLSITTSFFVFAGNALKCKIERTDGIVLYGECLEKDNLAFFRSCADFICQVNPSLTRGLVDEEKGCTEKPLNEKDFMEKLKQEHSNLALKDIPFCSHGK